MSPVSTRLLSLGTLSLGVLLLAGCSADVPSIETDSDVALKMRSVLESGAGAPKKEVVAQDPVGWGTIRGVLKLASAPPERQPLTLTGDDATYCSAAGKILSEEVVAEAGGQLKNALVMVSSTIPEDKPGWIHPDYADPAALLDEAQGFDQKNCVFLSHLYAFRAGQTVQIINSDTVGHNTNISGGEGSGGQAARAFNQLISAGATAQYDPGGACNLPMTVTCNIHPWMKAYIMVCPHPYFSVTDKDGSFELKNVPAGVELELRVWHEARVDVLDAEGEWPRGRRTFTLADGDMIDLALTASLD